MDKLVQAEVGASVREDEYEKADGDDHAIIHELRGIEISCHKSGQVAEEDKDEAAGGHEASEEAEDKAGADDKECPCEKSTRGTGAEGSGEPGIKVGQ